jgi:hypothetical protein
MGLRSAAWYWDMEGLHTKLAAGFAMLAVAWFKKGKREGTVAVDVWYWLRGGLLGEGWWGDSFEGASDEWAWLGWAVEIDREAWEGLEGAGADT